MFGFTCGDLICSKVTVSLELRTHAQAASKESCLGSTCLRQRGITLAKVLVLNHGARELTRMFRLLRPQTEHAGLVNSFDKFMAATQVGLRRS